MGRTLPSSNQNAFDLISELEQFYLVLRRGDQLILDEFFDAISQHRIAISSAENLLPIEILPFVILLEEHKRVDKICNEMLSRIEELEKKLELLLPPGLN